VTQASPPEPRASILLVDDRPENLLALRAILDPLDQDLVDARSGEEALKALLGRDFAVILLDVQMPELDGYETAELIKGRERTRHIPIIFLTALSKDEGAVFRGYLSGAVDYMLKPFDPDILRSKVSVFIELWRKNEQLKRQEEQLREQALAALRAESEERYRELADAMPQIVWTSSPDGAATYYNRRWFQYTGLTAKESGADAWRRVVHPDDLQLVLDRRAETLGTGEVFEVEYRFRADDGTYRWHLGRAVPIRRDDGTIGSWVGTATDIDEHRRAQDAQRFLVEAGTLLGGSLDYVSTLRTVADLAVRQIADWCAIDMLDEDGELRQLVITHADPAKRAFAQELQERYPPRREADPATRVVRTGETELVSAISDEMRESIAVDDLHLQIVRELGLKSYLCVPLEARGRTIGAITFVAAESGRRLGERDRWLAEELARRAGTAIDNAQLYREVEERAQAARVLASVGDGVFLVASDGTVRIWNAAAEAITGVTRAEIVGRPVSEAIGRWEDVAPRIPIADAPGYVSAETVPVEVRERELWLSISGVGFTDGTVYAFRDLTEERALEEMRQDIVATVSHELRTPLAAVYGSAVTLRRADLDLGDEMRERLLDVISEESERLAAIVNDLLTASQLDSGKIQVDVEQCDAREIAQGVITSAETHLPEGITLRLEAAKRLPKVQADPSQLRQVLTNLVENAIKYSPEGGRIRLLLEPVDSQLRVAVSDEGLGIPAAEQRRVFEKFYRLDPGMTRGIGGTGLGLYICRELVRRVGGRIWVESAEGRGSTFFVEVPAAASVAKPKEKAVAS
jgi:PAS domain S-box-containing protein